MGRILELHKTHIYDDDEEACVGFYVDMIQVCGLLGFVGL